ncbi:MAG: amidophosphoribosyltransferase [Halofilum sp. (in: g-proteobacteria)]
MCGIVGIYIKNPELRGQLGQLFSPMLIEMTDRGPDSAGLAVYSENGEAASKISLYHPDRQFDWEGLVQAAQRDLGVELTLRTISTHAIVSTVAEGADLRGWIESNHPELRVMSSGRMLEIYKEVGLPASVIERFDVAHMTGSHAVGHTRMATESAVSTEGAHPFNTGDDLCLVHNGSLSNHHSLRRWLRRHADFDFQTDNDSEVAAAYLTWRLREGDSLPEAIEAGFHDLDGFYTFAVGTRDGFSVVRDPIACKHAIMAETDDWVGMATEYRALARLPGVEHATVWEPKPATVYSWGH